MRILTENDVYALLPMKTCIEAVEQAMIAAAVGRAQQPPRQVYKLENEALFGAMPGVLGAPASFGAKLISIFPRAAGDPHQSHQGVVVLFDAETGFPAALMDGGAVTGVRTAAASAVATRALARQDARTLAILGTGHQAATHLEAMPLVRRLTEVRVWGRTPEKAERFARAHQAAFGGALVPAASVDAAVDGADIICTVTAATEPILFGRHLQPGVHVNAVGSGVAWMRELDETAVAKSCFIADLKASVLLQGGEFLKAKEAGLVGDDHILGDIGEVLSGACEGRRGADDITVYKSLGVVAQDLAAASAALQAAEKAGAGVIAPMRSLKH